MTTSTITATAECGGAVTFTVRTDAAPGSTGADVLALWGAYNVPGVDGAPIGHIAPGASVSWVTRLAPGVHQEGANVLVNGARHDAAAITFTVPSADACASSTSVVRTTTTAATSTTTVPTTRQTTTSTIDIGTAPVRTTTSTTGAGAGRIIGTTTTAAATTTTRPRGGGADRLPETGVGGIIVPGLVCGCVLVFVGWRATVWSAKGPRGRARQARRMARRRG